MTIKCTRKYGEVLDSGSIEHGFTDKAGRSVGYKWRIRALEYADLAPDHQYSYCSRNADAPRHVVELWGQPTRDGKGYGPAFNTVEFNTLEEARRDAVRRVEQAAKRDAKKFAKVPA
jgi:hypothetical protein